MNERKGIVLAGGSGSRLHPITMAVSKQLLPVYDKPMIYYPIATLMEAGIREILIICTPHDAPLFKRLFGSGHHLGMRFTYAHQPSPDGIAQAFIIGADFIGDSPSVLILGDNIFHAQEFSTTLKCISARSTGATVFAYKVNDPHRYGVIELDTQGNPISLQEKPLKPRSNLIIPGLYFYDNQVIDIARGLTPSARGELEITDINLEYMRRGQLNVERTNHNTTWMDAGTFEALREATNFVAITQGTHVTKIACLEEIAYTNKFITREI